MRAAWRDGAARLVQVRPHDGAHRVALRVGVSIAVPLLVLQVVDRPEWSIYAAFGAFPALYGRLEGYRARLRLQSELALVLVLAITAGAAVGASPERSWLSVPLAALFAAAAAWRSDVSGWHPPGPLFVVFAFAACASVPAGPGQVGVAALVATASAVVAVLVGVAGWVRGTVPGSRGRGSSAARPAVPQTRRHALRCAVAVLVAGSVATASGIGHPYWAMVSAVVPMVARDLGGQLLRGAQRLLGTLVGLVVAAALLQLPLRGVLLVAVVVVLQMGAELFVGRNYGLALVFVTPLALLLGQLAAAHPAAQLVLDRGIETLVGVLVALVVSLATLRRQAA